MIRPPRVIEQRAVCVIAAGLIATASSFVGSSVHAQQGTSASIAEQLFLQGRALMQEKKYESACEKFRASYDLDRSATGTLLNLALCHEATHKTATAWAEFRQVAAESMGRREERVVLAREHEQKLFPLLPWLRIEVPPGSRVRDLSLVLDSGAPIAEPAWGADFPIDPGKHVLRIAAPRMQSAERTITIGPSERQRIVIAPLAPEPDGKAATLDDAAPQPPDDGSSTRTRRMIGFALGGAGIAAIGVGLGFGVVAAKRNDEAKSLCPADRCASQDLKDNASQKLSSSNASANIANVAVGAGALFLAGGVVLVLTAPRASDPATRSSTKGAAFRAAAAPIAGGALVTFGGAL